MYSLDTYLSNIIILIIQAYIPIKTIDCSISNIQKSKDERVIVSKNCIKLEVELKVDVSFIIYIIGFLSFISWFIFVLFGGIGLAAIPLD